MRSLIAVCVLAVLCSGCVTYRDKVAVVRARKHAAETGTAIGEAVSAELGEVAVDIGADKIDPATVPVTVEASVENAEGIRAERASRSAIGMFLRKGGEWLADKIPWAGPAIGLALAGVEWLRRRKAQAESQRSGEIVGVLGRAATKLDNGTKLKDLIAEEAKSLLKINTTDVSTAVEQANVGEI